MLIRRRRIDNRHRLALGAAQPVFAVNLVSLNFQIDDGGQLEEARLSDRHDKRHAAWSDAKACDGQGADALRQGRHAADG